jgi:type I restriction enzyme S subunit
MAEKQPTPPKGAGQPQASPAQRDAAKPHKPGWRKVKFGDVVQLSKERCADPLAEGIERYVGLEHMEPGDLRIRSWGNVADGVTFTSLFKPGHVLFGKRRAYQRKVAVADFSGVCSGDIYVLESKDANVLLPELLPFICQTDAFFDHAVGTSAGSLSPRTNWTSLADFEFSLPSPDEQQNIVRLAHAHQGCSESYQQLISSTASLLLARTHEIFSSGVTSQSKRIGDIADVQYGLTVNAKRREAENMLPYLRVANTQRFKFDLAEIKAIGIEAKDSDCLLKQGVGARLKVPRPAR